MHDVLKLIGNVLQRYAKYKIAVAVNLILFTLILFLSIDWRLAPLRIEGINDTRLIHYTSHIIFIPLLCLYLPLKLLKKRYQSAKKAYLVGLLLSLMTGCVSASYTHLISEPGSFLFKIEGGVINTDDPRYDPNDPNDSYFTIMISTGVDGYETPMRDEYFFVEAFLHSLFYCFYMLCFLQAYGIFHKRELKQKLKQQQLDVLQYQLNPHFLFNSLNSIRGMLYEDIDEAKKLLMEFRQLFKHHFDNKRHCISLQHEMILCQHYLKLEKVRFEERLRISIAIPNELQVMLVPSMSVFTLIENAIKHGIAQIPKGGTIEIKARKENKELVINVDNPINADAKQADGTRTGLTNLESRLALLYQDHFTINCERSENLFAVELRVPLKKDRSSEKV